LELTINTGSLLVVVGTVPGSEGERADGEVVVAAQAADGRAGEVGE